jgi:hypothetical protein
MSTSSMSPDFISDCGHVSARFLGKPRTRLPRFPVATVTLKEVIIK